MSSESENALNDIVRDYLIENKVDSISRQINKILAKIQNSGSNKQHVALKWTNKLRKLFQCGCLELEIQSKNITVCINRLEIDLKNGSFLGNTTQRKRKRDLISKKNIPDSSSSLNIQKPILPGSQVAAKIARSHDLWILASVVRYIGTPADSYEIEDEDSGDEGDGHRHHVVNSKHILKLPNDGEELCHPVNSRVLVMYPNTTSFYPATVSVPNPKNFSYLLVKFDDDDDETGKIPDRKVPCRFVVPMPIK